MHYLVNDILYMILITLLMMKMSTLTKTVMLSLTLLTILVFVLEQRERREEYRAAVYKSFKGRDKTAVVARVLLLGW